MRLPSVTSLRLDAAAHRRADFGVLDVEVRGLHRRLRRLHAGGGLARLGGAGVGFLLRDGVARDQPVGAVEPLVGEVEARLGERQVGLGAAQDGGVRARVDR